MDKKFIDMKNQNTPPRTIYTNHYFNGEHSIPQLMRAAGITSAWAFEVLGGPTMDTLHEAGLLDMASLEAYTQEHFGISFEPPYPTTIIGLQWAEDADLKELAQSLHSIAIELMDNASGDDDFFDYTPDTVEALGQFCLKLGYPELEANLRSELEARGHYD